MNHLTEEQLVEHYFADDATRVPAETHLRICGKCAAAFSEICKTLAVRAPEPPAREAGYGKRLWRSIQGPLPAYPTPKRESFSWRGLVLASACMVALAVAFIGGSWWQRSRTQHTAAVNPAQAKERVVLLILNDHLDRSERLLVQLNHAGAEPDDTLQTEARQLLPDNRLYRETVATTNDPTMIAALDHLERVLLEVANSPDKLNSADVARIEREMNTDSLLFQIRVLRARTSRPESKMDSRKGTSI